MRATALRLLATAAFVALTAAPAALSKGSVTIGSATLTALRGTGPSLAPAPIVAVKKKDQLHSCQAGDRRSHVRTSASPVGETQRQAATVACEQPPRSTPNLSGVNAATGGLVAAG
jgi:hypothetical protein